MWAKRSSSSGTARTKRAARALGKFLTALPAALGSKPARVLQVNRGHWVIESCHYMIDWNYDEDRSRIRTGHGPENITRLRRFAIGVLKSKGRGGVAQKMRQLTRNVRLVFDYLRMSENSCACHLK